MTAARAGRWHPGSLGCRHGDRLSDVVRAHALPAGFEVVLDGGTWVALRGPGIDAEDLQPLYESLVGAK
jgi:hypothetical protein